MNFQIQRTEPTFQVISEFEADTNDDARFAFEQERKCRDETEQIQLVRVYRVARGWHMEREIK